MSEIQNSKDHRGIRLLEALASNRMNQEAIEVLWLAARSWLSQGGRFPMQRYARLPTTGPALARASRDLWFRRAAECLGDDTEIIKAHKLNMEFDKFLTRGPWLAWRELKDAPKDASELRRALFFAAKFSKGEVISDQTIYRALS